jgi:RimJ/RimL family protein N-acetyltransferase
MNVLETERLLLRPWALDDADAYYEGIISDPDVMRYLPGGVPRPRETAERSINFFLRHGEEHGFTLWAVEEKDTGALVGNCGLVYIPNAPNREVEVAYTLAKAFWGKGYATEGARASLKYGFEECNLAQVYGLAFADNQPSQKVLRKIGMVYEGTTDRFYNEHFECFSITREQYFAGKQQ